MASLGVSGCGFHGLLRLAGVNAAIYRAFYSVQKKNKKKSGLKKFLKPKIFLFRQKKHNQTLLQSTKANALRLNELLHAELLSMAALTPAQLVINQATARYLQTGNLHSGCFKGEKSPALDLALPV